MDEIERLKVKLRKRAKEQNELTDGYNELVDAYQYIVDHNNATVDLIRKKNQRIKQLKEERVQDAKSYKDEIEGLEEELEDLKKSHKSKVETKSQTIRDMVEERKDLQITLSKKNQQVEKVRELLDDRNFEAKKSIATTTRLDKQIGDETFRKAMDQIFERFRDCFMSIRRKHPFGKFRLSIG
jgi:chromosome segregation ATPase